MESQEGSAFSYTRTLQQQPTSGFFTCAQPPSVGDPGTEVTLSQSERNSLQQSKQKKPPTKQTLTSGDKESTPFQLPCCVTPCSTTATEGQAGSPALLLEHIHLALPPAGIVTQLV